MAAGDSGNFAGSLQEVLADSMIHFSKANVLLPLVMVEQREKADTITFPVYNLGSNTVTSSDVASHTQDDSSDIGATQLDSVKKTVTLSMSSIRVPVADEAVLSNANDVTGIAGQLVGNAMASFVDKSIAANFDNFSSAVDGSSAGIKVDHIFTALGTLQANAAPAPYSLCHNPKAIYGSFGLSNDLVTSNQFGGSPSSQDDMLKTGFLGTLAGIDIYTTPEVAISSDVAKGAVFSKMALGFAYAGELMRVEIERDAKKLKTDYIGSIFSGSVELADTYGIELTDKVQ